MNEEGRCNWDLQQTFFLARCLCYVLHTCDNDARVVYSNCIPVFLLFLLLPFIIPTSFLFVCLFGYLCLCTLLCFLFVSVFVFLSSSFGLYILML